MAVCACTVPEVAFGLREVPAPEVGDQPSAGFVLAYALACVKCRTAAQSLHGYEHALMLLRNGACEPPEVVRI